jgi:hypothetical protein
LAFPLPTRFPGLLRGCTASPAGSEGRVAPLLEFHETEAANFDHLLPPCGRTAVSGEDNCSIGSEKVPIRRAYAVGGSDDHAESKLNKSATLLSARHHDAPY